MLYGSYIVVIERFFFCSLRFQSELAKFMLLARAYCPISYVHTHVRVRMCYPHENHSVNIWSCSSLHNSWSAPSFSLSLSLPFSYPSSFLTLHLCSFPLLLLFLLSFFLRALFERKRFSREARRPIKVWASALSLCCTFSVNNFSFFLFRHTCECVLTTDCTV